MLTENINVNIPTHRRSFPYFHHFSKWMNTLGKKNGRTKIISSNIFPLSTPNIWVTLTTISSTTICSWHIILAECKNAIRLAFKSKQCHSRWRRTSVFDREPIWRFSLHFVYDCHFEHEADYSCVNALPSGMMMCRPKFRSCPENRSPKCYTFHSKYI